jgi:uncharacterized protein involved in exopolysaccharide biosynthesis
MSTAMTATEDLSFAEPAAAPAAPHPLANLARIMRGRWLLSASMAAILGGLLGTGGFFMGSRIYESQAILRLYPKEANILYKSTDDSVLKTFDSFAKAETSTVASHPVMERALASLPESFSHLTEGMTASHLGSSIDIKRNDSLIVLTTTSKDAAFATAKLEAVVTAYQGIQADSETARSVVRLTELQDREATLLAKRDEIRVKTLEVGGEFGIETLTKAHVEKVTQIEALAGRKAEVEATLATLKADSGTSSADMSDDEIMRATLLDRALADLNFDRAKREAELATLLTRYNETSRIVQDKREEIIVIDRAMAERREQIKVLGQTGALTDTSAATPEASIAEIEALLEKVSGQLELARREARDLNAKRATLAALEQDAQENRDLLEETRAALEVIRLEAGRALPGYSVVMSPPSVPTKAAVDTRKTNAIGGFGFGAFLAFVGVFLLGLTSRKVRHSDGLGRHAARVPTMLVTRETRPVAYEMDRLRNAIKLLQLRAPRKTTGAQVISIAPVDGGNSIDLANGLGASFARVGMKTLVIDAALRPSLNSDKTAGWREALSGQTVAPLAVDDHLFALPAGHDQDVNCGSVGTGRLRAALGNMTPDYDVVVIACGSLNDSVSSELILSESDFALACVTPTDRKATVNALIPRFDNLPRQGGAVVFTAAQSNDPGLGH